MIMEGIFDIISSIFAPAAKFVDNVHTSDEERLTLHAHLKAIEAGVDGKIIDLQAKVLEYEVKVLDAQSSVIRAEALGQSWIQRNWRPITMLTFLALVVLDSFDLLATRLVGSAWTLLEIGLGGYVIGRSLEKTAPAILRAINANKTP